MKIPAPPLSFCNIWHTANPGQTLDNQVEVDSIKRKTNRKARTRYSNSGVKHAQLPCEKWENETCTENAIKQSSSKMNLPAQQDSGLWALFHSRTSMGEFRGSLIDLQIFTVELRNEGQSVHHVSILKLCHILKEQDPPRLTGEIITESWNSLG